MAGTKVWNIGDVLTASDLNGNFAKLPYSSYSFRTTLAGPAGPGTSYEFAIAFPAGRFTVPPNYTVGTSQAIITCYVPSITAGTVVIGSKNTSPSVFATNFDVSLTFVQMTAGTANG
jgi:hypothetical protein